jgi:hypothetical protein
MVYLPAFSAGVPLYAHMLGVCSRGISEAWAFGGAFFGSKAHPFLQSLGWKRI